MRTLYSYLELWDPPFVPLDLLSSLHPVLCLQKVTYMDFSNQLPSLWLLDGLVQYDLQLEIKRRRKQDQDVNSLASSLQGCSGLAVSLIQRSLLLSRLYTSIPFQDLVTAPSLHSFHGSRTGNVFTATILELLHSPLQLLHTCTSINSPVINKSSMNDANFLLSCSWDLTNTVSIL